MKLTVTFSRRKNCEHAMRKKKNELRKLKPSELDLPNGQSST